MYPYMYTFKIKCNKLKYEVDEKNNEVFTYMSGLSVK